MYDIVLDQWGSQTYFIDGLSKIACMISSVYGTDMEMSAFNRSGELFFSTYADVIIRDGRFCDRQAEAARYMLNSIEMPEGGAATAILLADAYLKYARENGKGRKGCVNAVRKLTGFAVSEITRAACANQGVLAGECVFLLNIQRPVYRMMKNENMDEGSIGYIYALAEPVLTIARNCGRQPHEVFSRLQSVAPTQFYSLDQYGMSRSIPSTGDRDLWRFGLDGDRNEITDLFAVSKVVKGDTACAIMQAACEITERICRTAAPL